MRAGRIVRTTASRGRAAVRGAVHARRRRRAPATWTRRDPHRVLWVAPSDVVATTAVRLDVPSAGRVVAGDWDLDAVPLRSLALWRGLEQRIVDGRAWEETELARTDLAPEAPNVGTRARTTDPALRAERWRRLDALVASLRRDGWLAHHDIGAPFEREMAVAVARDGALLRDRGGLHRLIIAQLIGLERIPYRVLTEHPDAPAPR